MMLNVTECSEVKFAGFFFTIPDVRLCFNAVDCAIQLDRYIMVCYSILEGKAWQL